IRELAERGLRPEEEEEFERNGMPQFYFPVEITYATVHKERQGGRVVRATGPLVLGGEEQLEHTLAQRAQSRAVNPSFGERSHVTQRHFNGRKRRKAYTFSKGLSLHRACTWLVVVWCNFGWCVRTLRLKVQEAPPRYRYRTPAMAAGLADHPWAMR